MQDEIADETANTALSLIGLDIELRRHHYHSPDEVDQQLDLIEEGVITNLEWDEKDGLWVQFDEVVTFDITPTHSSICVYADEDPVVTLWANTIGAKWQSDWDAELTHTERQRFLRRVADLAERATQGARRATEALRVAAASDEQDDRAEAAALVRKWLAGR